MSVDYLVTGASGFIGLNLFQRVKGEKVVILRDLNLYPWAWRILNKSQIAFGDLLDEKFVHRVLAEYRPRVVFNFAAIAIVRTALNFPSMTIHNNVISLTNLLEACRRADCAELIVHLSTDKVYGEGDGKKETDPLTFSEPYGASKACQDLVALSYAKSYGLPIVIPRACNTYGEFDTNPRIIPNTIRGLIERKPVKVFKNVTYHRQYIYVRDMISAIEFIVGIKDSAKGEIYNIGTDSITDQNGLVKLIIDVFEEETGYRGAIEEDSIDIVEIGSQSLDYSRIADLGWKPSISLEEGIRRTIKFWLRFYLEISTSNRRAVWDASLHSPERF